MSEASDFLALVYTVKIELAGRTMEEKLNEVAMRTPGYLNMGLAREVFGEEVPRTRENLELGRACQAWGRALKKRDNCGKGPLECGAVCVLKMLHDGPCLCGGDENGVPGTCPA